MMCFMFLVLNLSYFHSALLATHQFSVVFSPTNFIIQDSHQKIIGMGKLIPKSAYHETISSLSLFPFSFFFCFVQIHHSVRSVFSLFFAIQWVFLILLDFYVDSDQTTIWFPVKPVRPVCPVQFSKSCSHKDNFTSL